MSEFFEYVKKILVLFSNDFFRELIIGVSVTGIVEFIRWCKKKWKADRKNLSMLEKDIEQ